MEFKEPAGGDVCSACGGESGWHKIGCSVNERDGLDNASAMRESIKQQAPAESVEPTEFTSDDLEEISPEEAEQIEAKKLEEQRAKLEQLERSGVINEYRKGERSEQDTCAYFGCDGGWHKIGCPVSRQD